jgi:hypothetical protein
MTNHEQTVRDAALALETAIVAATKAGYIVAYPRYGKPITDLVICETGKVDGLGNPLEITEDERQALPPLDLSEAVDGVGQDAVIAFGKLKGAAVNPPAKE